MIEVSKRPDLVNQTTLSVRHAPIWYRIESVNNRQIVVK